MAKYSIKFRLGPEHIFFTSGDSTYPTKDQYLNEEYNERLIKDNVSVFISTYMEINRLKGKPYDIIYNISFD